MMGICAPNPPRNGEGDQPQAGGGGAAILSQPIQQVKRARALRKQMSLPEVLLWDQLRKRPDGFKFRRQFPLSPYTIDFVCLSARVAIEIDGESHNRGQQPVVDARRDQVLAEAGFRVMRLNAVDVLRNMTGCLTAIVVACREVAPPPPSLCDGPPPRAGEDLR